MRCKQAEKLLIEAATTTLTPARKAALDFHLASCSRCRSFADHLMKMRTGIDDMKNKQPSLQLAENTLLLCRQKLHEQFERQPAGTLQTTVVTTPKWLFAAIVVLLSLTIAWALPVIQDLVTKKLITNQTILCFILFAQNMIMLLLTPILVRMRKVDHNPGSQLLNGYIG